MKSALEGLYAILPGHSGNPDNSPKSSPYGKQKPNQPAFRCMSRTSRVTAGANSGVLDEAAQCAFQSECRIAKANQKEPDSAKVKPNRS